MAEPGERGTLTAAQDSRGPGAGRRIRYLFSGIWLLYLIQPIAGLFGHRHGVAWIAGGVAGSASDRGRSPARGRN